MSTQEHHKVVNLYSEQINAFRDAREAVKQDLGEEATEGEIVKALAVAYTARGPDAAPEAIADLVDDHASHHGDPVLGYDALQKMNPKRIRRMAAEADGEITGRHTRLEWYSYFARGGDR